MISSYNNTSQEVAINGLLTFTTDRILTGCTATRNGQTFQLNKPGYYYVTFNTTFTTEATGEATVELQNNGLVVPGATGTETVTTAGDSNSISFATIVRVLPSCNVIDNTARLTFVATGIALNATVANVNITKLC
mgnify:CR=1 FL=1